MRINTHISVDVSFFYPGRIWRPTDVKEDQPKTNKITPGLFGQECKIFPKPLNFDWTQSARLRYGSSGRTDRDSSVWEHDHQPISNIVKCFIDPSHL